MAENVEFIWGCFNSAKQISHQVFIQKLSRFPIKCSFKNWCTRAWRWRHNVVLILLCAWRWRHNVLLILLCAFCIDGMMVMKMSSHFLQGFSSVCSAKGVWPWRCPAETFLERILSKLSGLACKVRVESGWVCSWMLYIRQSMRDICCLDNWSRSKMTWRYERLGSFAAAS